MSRAQIVEMARRDLDYGRKGTQDQAEDIFKVPASHYFDSARFQEEKEKIFHRLPLVLAAVKPQLVWQPQRLTRALLSCTILTALQLELRPAARKMVTVPLQLA